MPRPGRTHLEREIVWEKEAGLDQGIVVFLLSPYPTKHIHSHTMPTLKIDVHTHILPKVMKLNFSNYSALAGFRKKIWIPWVAKARPPAIPDQHAFGWKTFSND